MKTKQQEKEYGEEYAKESGKEGGKEHRESYPKQEIFNNIFKLSSNFSEPGRQKYRSFIYLFKASFYLYKG